ncbi:PAK4-inhibitor INKA2 isoform X2 [Ambystoma mexicanum]|uniref:PAK4-inhibitor INKA2 isoform X2 n=1 Tax=Ambystoma mexicanum TaxID=8296 RepID=UPI0037E8DDD3
MERRAMDVYLRRLKQELVRSPSVSMKEVGDGLHEQMNCMMGALQELKLLQVQTALERMEISGGASQLQSVGQRPCCWKSPEVASVRSESRTPQEYTQVAERYSEDRRSFSSSSCSVGVHSPVSSLGNGQLHMPLPFRTVHSDEGLTETASSLSTLECCSPGTFQSASSAYESLPDTGAHHPREVSSSYERECQDGSVADDTEDWTSSLMSQSRNRQPLVLGDNIFADLVGNWLDLPEVDKKGEKADSTLSISRSQEVYRKFSLTANIFKKFLRSVRPDKSKLLKEKPCWLPADEKAAEISKRSKKGNKQKGTFYFSFHNNNNNNMQNAHNKAEKMNRKEEIKEQPSFCPHRIHNRADHAQTGFDFNTVVWV